MDNLDMADLKRLLHAKTIFLQQFVKYSSKLSKRIQSQPVTAAEDGPVFTAARPPLYGRTLAESSRLCTSNAPRHAD